MSNLKSQMSNLDQLAWRNLAQHRTRTALSILAIALGVAMTIAGNMTGRSVINSLSSAEEVQAIIRGLLDQFNMMLMLIGVAITAAAGFIIFNAFMMSITQRRQQIGALRSLGMTRGQVMRVTLVEALLAGGIGTGIGLVAGPLLGSGVIALSRVMLTDLFIFTNSGADWWSYLLAAGLGIGITLLAVLIPANSAARTSPLVAMRPEAADDGARSRWSLPLLVVGILLAAGLAAWLIIAPPGEWVMPPLDVPLAVLCVAGWLLGVLMMLPALIDGIGRGLRRPLTSRWGATGRLIADNVRRGRGRVALTILSLALALVMIIGLTGFISFAFNELFYPQVEGSLQFNGAQIAPFDLSTGMTGYADMDRLALPEEMITELPATVGDRAEVVEWQFLIVPELSFFGSNYFSFMMEPQYIRDMGNWVFTFTEGNWDTALPVMQQGCGILVTPAVATRNRAGLGDTIRVTGPNGPVDCRVAGIGSPYVNATLIGLAAKADFGLGDPFAILIAPKPGVDREALMADVRNLLARYPGSYLNELSTLAGLQKQMFSAVPNLFGAVLILALVAAALGVVNTVMMGVTERRRELGLLRAVGATRRQVSQVVAGEAAVMGAIGGLVGLVAGLGVIAVIVLVYGGNGWGMSNIALWPAAIRSLGRSLPAALAGLVAAPLVAAAAAYFPARSIVRGAAIDTLDEQRTPQPERYRPAQRGIMQRLGSLALRNLAQQRTRTILSAVAVTLGVALTIMADVVGHSLLNGMTQTEELAAITKGLTDQLVTWMTLAGVAVTLAAGFIIFNAFMMSVTQRRRQIGVLRSLGMTRRQVMRQVILEALLVGGGGTLLGLVIGPVAGRGVLSLIEAADFQMLPFIAADPNPWIVVLAAGLGLGISLLSVYFPARGATRISPLEALQEQRTQPRTRAHIVLPALVGLLLMTALWVYLALNPPGDWAKTPLNLTLTLVGSAVWLAAIGLVLPALPGAAARLARWVLPRFSAANGRLVADNLGRDPLRVTLTAVALGLGVALSIAMTGYFNFLYGEFFAPFMEQRAGQRKLDFTAFDLDGEVGSYASQESLVLDPGVIDEVYRIVGNRAVIGQSTFAIIPELSVMGDSFFTFLMEPRPMVEQATRIGQPVFTFSQGSWEEALPIMEAGCGALVVPAVAERNGVGLYDHLTLTGTNGPVDCIIAGLGQTSFGGASVVSDTAAGALGVETPMDLSIFPLPGQDADTLQADLEALATRYPHAYLTSSEAQGEHIGQLNGMVLAMMNAMLMLAVVAGALGVVNTTVMSVSERRHELGLLRAIGATRRQALRIVTGESALIGLLGGAIGTVAGVGLIAIMATTYGGSDFGVELDVWAAAGRNALSALLVAAFGLIVSPLVAAGAAWLPARSILRGSAIETMDASRTLQGGAGRPEPSGIMSRLDFLAWRNLQQHRTRTILSVLAVALGVAMTLAASMIGQSILGAISGAEGLTYLRGLINQLGIMFEMAGEAIGLVAGFMVFNAFLMSITQRRQQIGALRSLGMTRGQVMRLVLVEALVVAIIGTLAGMITGPILGAGAAAFARMVLSGMFAIKTSSPTLTSVVMAVGIGIGITLLAVLIPARQAARISSLVALRGEVAAGTRSRISNRLAFWIGVLVLAGLAAFVIGALPGEWVEPPQDILLMGLCLGLLALGLALVLPGLVGGAGSLARGILRRAMGASGRLATDNLERERGRVVRTLAVLAVSLALIAGLQGILHFVSYEIMMPTLNKVAQSGAWIILPFDISEGLVAASSMERVEVPSGATAELRQVVGERGTVLDIHFIIVPELSFIGDTFFSILADPHILRQSGSSIFTFTEGSWDTAMPIMEQGCGVLTSPAVAARNGVKPGDRLTVTGKSGPVECILAGIGSPLANATLISLAAGEQFGAANPTGLIVWAQGGDRQAVQADMEAALAHYPSLHMTDFQTLYEFDLTATDALPPLFNMLLVVATVAAALGVVNTTLMSVTERRRELGLLRAVGATRRQVMQVVVGEAVLIGLVGGIVGLVAGVGITAIVVLVYGGNAWGAPDLDLWGAAWRSAQPALVTGLIGLAAAPLISAGAAYFPARSILRGSAIETLEPERQETVSARRAAGQRRLNAAWRWGSIQARFAVGTALLTLVVLGGLITVVTEHARGRIEETLHDTLSQMVTFDAGMLALALPEDADNLDFDAMASGQSFDFNADTMLEMETLFDDFSANELVDFTIADRNDVILMSLDKRDMGMMAPTLDEPGETVVTSTREDGRWLMAAIAPVRNPAGDVVGSVRMTVDADAAQDFLDTLRGRLWAIGGLLAAIGTLLAWWVGAPLARTASRLAGHAAEIGQGQYTRFGEQAARGLVRLLPIKTRLTLALAGILALTVGLLGVMAIPIERQHLDETVRDGLAAGAEWIGRMASRSFDMEGIELPDEQNASLADIIDQTGTLDIGRLQELGEGMQSDDLAFTALVDQDGEIVLSDQLSLVGEAAPVYPEARVEEATWRDEAVWVASTPLRRGEDGEQIGSLRMAMRRERVDAFLDEARSLFWLAGLAAVLAGILLAQAIGGAAAAPVAELAAGARRIGQGDLGVRFRVEGRDELAALANAYNQMVEGLEEREWLRDMFGRFVSQEVAEAIRSGQVRLEGENRVVSVLFCDIRDFTGLSERYPPQEIVALLNQYLPVVVSAAAAHGGTVNKFGGDSTLVIYGAPRQLAESAYQAVLTALDMQRDLALLNEELTTRGYDPIRIGVGINTGEVLAGAVGPRERQEYTVIGDTVNLASRIEGLNKQFPEHSILVSQWTYEALGAHRGEFGLVDLGKVAIRGKSGKVGVWAVEAI